MSATINNEALAADVVTRWSTPQHPIPGTASVGGHDEKDGGVGRGSRPSPAKLPLEFRFERASVCLAGLAEACSMIARESFLYTLPLPPYHDHDSTMYGITGLCSFLLLNTLLIDCTDLD